MMPMVYSIFHCYFKGECICVVLLSTCREAVYSRVREQARCAWFDPSVIIRWKFIFSLRIFVTALYF